MNKLLKFALPCLLFAAASCKKNTSCAYDTVCIEQEPNGFMVGTMGSDANTGNRVATIYNTLHNSNAPIGDSWSESSLGANQVSRIFPKYWVSDSIGQVFGIALDHNANVFLSATDVYRYDYNYFGAGNFFPTGYGSATASAGASGIYKTNYNTPNITIPLVKTRPVASANTTGFAEIPNSGSSLSYGIIPVGGNSIGNIAYDYTNNQLFATNLEDGRIYRINPTTGIVKSIFDPFVLDNGIAGMAPAGEQIWGIGIYTKGGVTTVYFARTTSTYDKEIWSIDLTPSGEFIAPPIAGLATDPTLTLTKKQIIVMPGAQPQGAQPHITDIAFSSTGKMLLAERGRPHNAQIFEYTFTGLAWVSGNNFYVGTDLSSAGPYIKGHNSAGGVDYSSREIKNSTPSFLCNDLVWGTSNAMFTKTFKNPAFSYPNYVYGAQGMSSSGNNPIVSNNESTDLYINYFGPVSNNSGDVKGKIGDIEFFDQTCPCK